MLGINKNYRIASDGRQYMVQKLSGKIKVKDKDSGEERMEDNWISEAFLSSLGACFSWLVDKHVKMAIANETTIKGIMNRIDEIEASAMELKALSMIESGLERLVIKLGEVE